jgi:hypothetical protein
MLAPVAHKQRVRCRQIAESDHAALADLLAAGFPRSSRSYWAEGFARLSTLAPVAGMPRFGYVLESELDLVGVLLLICSRRCDGGVIANLSSWYVEPAWRSHSALLMSMATRLRHVTYLNASPAPHTWRTLKGQGFHPYNLGRSAVFPAFGFGGGRVRETIPDDLPERDMLLAHRAFGCISLVCEKKDGVFPFILKPRRLEAPKVAMMELIYCRSTASFRHCAAALGRHVLKHGALGFLVDGRIDGMISHYVAGKEPRFYKGAKAPALNDLAYSEKVILG